MAVLNRIAGMSRGACCCHTFVVGDGDAGRAASWMPGHAGNINAHTLAVLHKLLRGAIIADCTDQQWLGPLLQVPAGRARWERQGQHCCSSLCAACSSST